MRKELTDDDMPESLRAEMERIWKMYSLDGETIPAELEERALTAFEDAVRAHGYKLPN